MAENERDFKGVWIPKHVWLDTRLNALDKIVLVEVDSLDMSERGCYASNKHIAEFCQCSETKVSTAISKLIKLGYLYVKHFDGRQRELKSCLSNFESLPFKNCEAAVKKVKESNTDNNTTNNTKKKKESKSSFDAIIANYAKGNEELTELLGEWLKVRKAKRSAMTDRAIQMNIDKLDKLAAESKMSVPDYLKEVICRGWAAFFAINNYQKPQQPAKPNKFNNFQQRQYDYDAMEAMLLKQQNPPKTAGEDPDIQRRAEALQQRLSTV